MAEGMKIKLSALPGLTVDENGRKLLASPFVFQCPPMDEFKVARLFTFGNYDTITDGQFARRGGRQLKTWQFDTLAMEIGVSEDGTRRSPGWVPFPAFDAPGRPVPPQWYVKQLDAIHDAGCPFKLTASWAGGRAGSPFNESAAALGPVLSIGAIMLGFTEGHKHGEGDAVYLESMSFSEWRDPLASQRGLGIASPSKSGLPTKVKLERNGHVLTARGQLIVGHNKKGVTAAELAKYFYHDPTLWRTIFSANKLKGGSANTPLIALPRYKALLGKKKKNTEILATLTIPVPFDTGTTRSPGRDSHPNVGHRLR